MAKNRKDSESLPTDADVRDALERVLTHAENHGEVYPGAADDHALIRATIAPKEDADSTDE